MKKGIFGIAAVLCLVLLLVAGCGSNGPATVGPTPTPTPTPIDWPAATTDWRDSGTTPITVPSNIAGALGTLATKSDGTNLYIKVTFSTVGLGHNFWLLVDDTQQTSGYDASRWDSNFTIMWGNMGMTIPDFDLDFIYLRGRSWDALTAGQWVTDSWAKIAHAVVGAQESDITDQTANCSDVPSAGVSDYSSYEITIPYSSIGKNGAASGDKIKIVALLGRETYTSTQGTFISSTPLGIQTAIPGDNTSITDEGTATARIANIKSAVLCTLK